VLGHKSTREEPSPFPSGKGCAGLSQGRGAFFYKGTRCNLKGNLPPLKEERKFDDRLTCEPKP